jgi:hypothetical protein
MITKEKLTKARPENVIRFAKWLGLNIKGMSLRQIIKLVRWRVNRGMHQYY